MSKKTITVLCEGVLDAAFITRFLRKKNKICYPSSVFSKGGWTYVCKEYPKLLDAMRKKNGFLLVMIDADSEGADGRLRQLDKACRKYESKKRKGISPRQPGDPVAVFIPDRNIEAWISYLDNQAGRAYKNLKGRERECAQHVNELDEMCEKNELPDNAPPSLKRACGEWKRVP